eukprot:CAMPEP_0171091460 /NCGR_PEP_ID=MMETSP0766_2-20121228/33488_1 /TAXON_ID=439317 /ORGANISM="Gambierdiscus australes, Strain CAWD 149" /LENGTH=40 /DNA_ID= /DNA_START= /DNA_END= /DNA_ORIENTATION=
MAATAAAQQPTGATAPGGQAQVGAGERRELRALQEAPGSR